jgi:hypothetical protein
MAIGFLVGLTAGALVLTAIYNRTGGSVLAVAVWHALYNLCAATKAGEGTIGAVATGCVIFWAVQLVQRERAGIPALGGNAPGRLRASHPDAWLQVDAQTLHLRASSAEGEE